MATSKDLHLGINKSHCASLCLVDKAGVPVFAASEERFTRVKLQRGMPHKTYEFLSKAYDISEARISIGRLPTSQRIIREAEYYLHGIRAKRYTIPLTQRLSEVAYFYYKKKIKQDRSLHRLSIDTRYFMNRPVDQGFEHHLCHMASAYYCSGFKEAVGVTVDGVGDLLSALVATCKDGDIKVKEKRFFNEHFSGQAYEVVTGMLGFDPDRHPGKVTGLAAYKKAPDALVSELDKWFQEQYRNGAEQNWFIAIHTRDEKQCLAELRKLREDRFGKWSREEISSAIQFILERDVVNFIKSHVPHPETQNIVLAGGVFANVKLNQRIKEMGFKGIFIQPAMGDEGIGLGSAILSAREKNHFLPHELHDVYLGPGYSKEEIRASLDKFQVAYEEFSGADHPLEKKLAQLLSEGYIIGRFQGRMEFGPRSLGNRSILYEAKDPTANDWLNRQLKRSEFMPFAPVTLYEHAAACYKNVAGAEHAAEFMTITFDATDEMKKSSPACIHVDGTARPQLVKESVNSSLYWTIKHYHEITGIPTLINTSFNMHEEPIVCTPSEAIQAYLSADLDALAIGDFLVVNPKRRADQKQK